MTETMKRLREPSSWSGIAAILITVGLSTELAGAITHTAAAITGLLALILPEQKGAF